MILIYSINRLLNEYLYKELYDNSSLCYNISSKILMIINN